MLLLLVIVSFISACGGGDSASKGSDDSGSSSNTSEGESGSSSSGDSSSTNGGETSDGSSGGDTSGGDTSGGDTSGGDTSGGDTSGGDTSGGDTSGGGTTASTYSPYAGGTGRGAVRLKTVTNADGSVETFYYNNAPSKAGTISYSIYVVDGGEILTSSYEYTLGQVSNVKIYAEESNGQVTRDETMKVHAGSTNFEPINAQVVATANVTVRGGLLHGEYTKTYTYALNASNNAYRISKVDITGPANNVVYYQYDTVGRLERITMTTPSSPSGSGLIFKHVYDSANKLIAHYQGSVDSTLADSEDKQFTEKHIYSYKKGLGGVDLLTTVAEYNREDSSEAWQLENTASYEYESGVCNYHYLQVSILLDGINSPFVKIQCPH